MILVRSCSFIAMHAFWTYCPLWASLRRTLDTKATQLVEYCSKQDEEDGSDSNRVLSNDCSRATFAGTYWLLIWTDENSFSFHQFFLLSLKIVVFCQVNLLFYFLKTLWNIFYVPAATKAFTIIATLFIVVSSKNNFLKNCGNATVRTWWCCQTFSKCILYSIQDCLGRSNTDTASNFATSSGTLDNAKCVLLARLAIKVLFRVKKASADDVCRRSALSPFSKQLSQNRPLYCLQLSVQRKLTICWGFMTAKSACSLNVQGVHNVFEWFENFM